MDKSVPKILIIDDEYKILDVIKALLESKGYIAFTAENAEQAFDILAEEHISLVILDLMLPEISGEEICRMIRKKSTVPIIMLTAKVEESDMIVGLGIGADDYITKPFSLKTLLARVEAVLRRSSYEKLQLKDVSGYLGSELVIDFENHMVAKHGIDVKLTPKEFKLLSTLAKHPNKVFTRDELITIALGDDFYGFDRTIDSHIKNIRQKIETDPRNPIYLVTIHGVGYKFGGN